MKRLTLVFAYLLLCTWAVFGQTGEWTTVYSEDLHFMASFPGEPRKSTLQTETSFGKGTAQRWVTEGQGIAYEILVTEFSDFPMKTGAKELRAFYEAACIEIGGSTRECHGFMGYDMFGESGVSKGLRRSGGSVEFHMFLVGERWYLVKVEVIESALKDTADERKKFLDEFLFTHVDAKEKKLKWGLPKSEP